MLKISQGVFSSFYACHHYSIYQPPVFLTSLTQGGEPIKIGKASERITEIWLDWRHNFFEFEAAALNYRHAELNKLLADSVGELAVLKNKNVNSKFK